MSVCPHCGQDRPDTARWGGLEARDMGEVFWRGIRLPVTLGQARLLKVLMRRGEATRLALEMTCGSPAGKSVEAQLCHLRRKLRAAGVPIAITAIRGVGYRLEENAA